DAQVVLLHSREALEGNALLAEGADGLVGAGDTPAQYGERVGLEVGDGGDVDDAEGDAVRVEHHREGVFADQLQPAGLRLKPTGFLGVASGDEGDGVCVAKHDAPNVPPGRR